MSMVLSFPAITYRKKCQLLALFSAIIIATIFLRGWQLDLVESVTDRLRFHAIPVAVSVVYHNHPHDYTAIREVAMPFQVPGSLKQLLSEAVHQEIKQRDTYYWVADDRGYADFVIVAFRMFGAKLNSLYLLWFVCLIFTVGLFIVSFRGRLSSLALLGMTLIGVYLAISVLPLADEADFLNVQSSGRLSSVSIYEPRFLDVLAMIPLIHICLFALRRTWPPSGIQMAGLVGQMGLFFWLYHARSSLGWQIMAMATVSVLAILLHRWHRRPLGSNRYKRVLSPALVLALLIIGLATLSLYQRAVYNPRYFGDMGARTFWHNALMGISDKVLSEKYSLTYGDLGSARAVIRYANLGECPSYVAMLDPQGLLNSLGGHGVKDWGAYESCARKLYISLWRNHTSRMLRIYLVTKPKETFVALLGTIRPGQPIADGIRYQRNIGWYPFSGAALAFAVIVLWVASSAIYRKRRQFLTLMTIIFVTSLIPSVSFYAAVLTMGGVFVTITVLCYLLSLLVVRRFIHWLYAETAR